MVRVSMALVSLLFAACASAPTSELLVGEPLVAQPSARSAHHGPVPADAAYEVAVLAPPSGGEALAVGTFMSVSAVPASPPLRASTAAQDESLHHSRFTIKGGLYSAEDADELDDGWILNVSWMRFFTKLFALELEAGYLDASGEEGGVDGDLWAMPLMVNGRLNLPLWILDVYGGAGLGTVYYDVEASGGGLSAEDDGFLLGGNVFLGATVNVADAVALGLEGKYYVTEDIDDVDAGLDAFALMLTLGFSR